MKNFFRRLGKTARIILVVVVVLFLVAVYLNTGDYLVRAANNADAVGIGKIFLTPFGDSWEFDDTFWSRVLWPGEVVIMMSAWVLYAIILAGVSTWNFLVAVFAHGALFDWLGPFGSAIVAMATAIIVWLRIKRWARRRREKHEKKMVAMAAERAVHSD